jgi:hypothetical protein
MKIFKNIDGLACFQLETDEEIDKFCIYSYNNDNWINEHYKDVNDYKRYVNRSKTHFVVDSLKTEKLLNEFSKLVDTKYENKIDKKSIFICKKVTDEIIMCRDKINNLNKLEEKLQQLILNEEYEKCEEIQNEILWWKENVIKKG